MTEIWFPIPGYGGHYLVSDQGRVASFRKGGYRPLTQHLDTRGYPKVTLSKDGQLHTFRVHRLVAQAFLPNPEGFTEVNHRNEVKTDNRVVNLEWCDRSYNINYGNRTEKQRLRLSKPVMQFSLSDDFLSTFESVATAARVTGIGASQIAACCKGKRYRAGEYRWCFIGEGARS